MASNSGSPGSSPVPPPVSVPNGHFVNGDSGQAMSQAPQMPPGAGPPPPQHGGYPPYGGYGPPMAAPQKPMMPHNPSGGYPPPPNARYPTGQSIAQQGGPTPTLNSLLQGRNQRMPGSGPPAPGPYGPPQQSGGYPQPWPNDPNYAAAYRQPHPGHRPPYGPSTPQQGPYPGPHPGQHPGYHGMPPQHPGYPYPHGRYPAPPGPQLINDPNSPSPVNTNPTPPTSGIPVTAGGVEGPPPHPGRHEGRPSTTWTPPVQADGSQGNVNTQPQQPPQQPGYESPGPNAAPEVEDENGGSDPQRGTPGIRPTPSPTGSSSSRSMSPAVGAQQSMPPRPPSNSSDQGNGPSSRSSSSGQPMQGGYQQPPMGPPANMMYNSKMAPGPQQPGPPQQHPSQQQIPQYGGQPAPNYGHYGPRPGYGPGGYPAAYGRPNSIPSGYPGYPGGQQYSGGWGNAGAPLSQPPQQQQQQPLPPGMMPSSGKGAPQPGPPGGPPQQRHPGPPVPGQYPPRPPQQQQMMKGYPPQQGVPPQSNSYGGPPMYNGPGMAPPGSNSMYNGPGMPPPPNSASGLGVPPQSYPGPYPNAHPMNSYGGPTSMPQPHGGMSPASVAAPTGPDGVPLHDETSQQSTLSQSSDRSDGRQTPKTGANFMPGQGYTPSSAGPASPRSSAPSPGGSMGSGADYPRDIASPNWQRTQASPGSAAGQQMYNSPAFGGISGGPPMSSSSGGPNFAPESTPSKLPKVSKSSETITRLFEMDDNPDRRMFLERLLSYMEERGTPITTCPTISKNPLDLYKLYILTKEKGGYLECTKNKTWKDTAAQLGIGASSSGAYTLKKHYGKNLLAYECQFDRGGMDPAPILAQVEGQMKKKAKASMSQPPPAPSPGSQDSRDSYSNSSDPYSSGYPIPGNNSGDGPPGQGYPPGSPYGYSQGGPPSGYPPSAYPPGSAPGPRPNWPGYSPGSGPPPPTSGDAYGRPGWPQPPASYSPRPPYPGGQSGPPTASAGGSANQPQPYPDQFQPKTGVPPLPSTSKPSGMLQQNSLSQLPQGYPGGTPPAGQASGKSTSGPTASQSPRPGGPPNAYPYQGPRPPMYPGGSQPQWPNRFPAPGAPAGDRSWPAPPGSPSGPSRAPGASGQWSSDRTSYYGPSGGPGSGQGPWNSSSGPMGKSSGVRPPFRGDVRGPAPVGPQRPSFPGGRREMNFPPGCVEATPPYMMKRRKYCKVDVQPVEGWRLVMALRSGLLMESTWALDVINILLYDDNGVTYFGLGNMPGLLEALLEHWRASLIAMFGITEDVEINTDASKERRSLKRTRSIDVGKKRQWFDRKKSVDSEDTYDLGVAGNVDPTDKRVVLTSFTDDFTKRPRFVEEDVQFQDRDDDLFVTDDCRQWDAFDEGFEGGMMHWINGGGNTTDHIVTHFAADLGKAAFARKITDAPTIKPKVENKKMHSAGADPVKVKDELGIDESLCEDEPEEDIVDKIQRVTGIVLRDPELARKRWKNTLLEDENYVRDEPSLQLISEADDNLGKRAVCVSTILRNLSFVPGNEYELSKNASLLAIIGRLLLLHHWYPNRPSKQRNYDRGEEDEIAESCTSLTGEDEWWWDYLHVIRENVMVILANISGALDLEPFEEEISRPIFDGLLEWSVSSSAYAQDPFPNVGPTSAVSPQRCAIEALCKLCLLETNVDLMLTTPPFSRIEKLTKMLAKKLYRFEDQVLREFSINLLYYLSAADTGISRTIALSDTTVSLLLSFIEQAEQNAMVIAQQHGVNALRDNPDSMGTSLDMLRRAANTLSNLSKHKDNILLLVRQEQRILSLVMSQILDQGVAAILSNVLYNIGANAAPPPPPPVLPTTPPLSPLPEGHRFTFSLPAPETVKPAEVVEPAKPVKSANAVESSEPVKPDPPVAPAETVEPVKPEEPVKPVEPTQSVSPVQPVEPGEPVNSVDTSETVTAAEPAKTVEAIDPVEPAERVDTVKPSETAAVEAEATET